MMNTPQTQDKSLLIQTVALFEALLGKMHHLQEENDSMRTKLENNIEIEQLTKDRDQIVLELESTMQRLEDSKQVIIAFIYSIFEDNLTQCARKKNTS